jgi:hypothetical protein
VQRGGGFHPRRRKISSRDLIVFESLETGWRLQVKKPTLMCVLHKEKDPHSLPPSRLRMCVPASPIGNNVNDDDDNDHDDDDDGGLMMGVVRWVDP